MKVGLVVHHRRSASREAAVEAAAHLRTLGVDVAMARPDAEQPDVGVPQLSHDAFADGLDLAMSFGGDGTFLRAAHLCRGAGVPILGLNLGRLGFLADAELDDLDEVLHAVANRDFRIEERPTLEVWSSDSEGRRLSEDWALNEVSIEKSARQRILLMELHVARSRFARIPADALVVATSTGSTAYAFSAGGPILSPEVRALLVTPVAPHSLFARTVVVGEDEQIDVEILPEQSPAIVSCDGREPVTVPAGGWVHATGGGQPVRLARVSSIDFYGVVRTKFGLR